jgi:hypothetical protein
MDLSERNKKRLKAQGYPITDLDVKVYEVFGSPDDLETFRVVVGRPSTKAERSGVRVTYGGD